ncbi:MAG: type II toxin-antitoxin system prevent-host-death family antitoxin [Methanomassiliicoccaceae archaeon]|jgi:prevent-host-death family protein|nr:type II toxin-antitoxin system prevent-host-death family antitoxin [Methanomassiliicoccaceae archaeon]
MITINASEARADLYDLIERAMDEPVRITSKRGTVLMISEEEWEGIMETLYLLGVPGLLEDIKEGRATPRSEMIRVKSSDL